MFQLKPPIWQVRNPAVSYLHVWPKVCRQDYWETNPTSSQSRLHWKERVQTLEIDQDWVLILQQTLPWFLSSCHNNYFGSIHQHCTKQRLKISKLAKFEKDKFEVSQETLSNLRDVCMVGSSLYPPPAPSYKHLEKTSRLCRAILLLFSHRSLSNSGPFLVLRPFLQWFWRIFTNSSKSKVGISQKGL